MKKLMVAALALAFVFVAGSAMAQVTMGAYIDADQVVGNNPLQSGNVTISMGQMFSLVVLADNIAPNFFAYEFTVTPITAAGVFAVGSTKFGGAVDLGNNAIGEYIVGVGYCEDAASTAELVRINYGAFGGAPGADTVIALTGSDPSSFGGEPGLAACDESLIFVEPGTEGGYTGSQTTFPDGGLVINGTAVVVDAAQATFGQMKARF